LTLLDEITSEVRKAVEIKKREMPIDKLPSRSTEFRSLSDAIEECQGVPVIAEIKPRSPSAGILKPDLNVGALAKVYESGGAVGISVLTEPKYFGGSLQNLVKVKESVELPILRKDFIIDEYQVHESVAYGADSLLLIVSCLGDELHKFLSLANNLGLEAVVECHSEPEIEKAVEAGAKLIGINNRDLKTLKIDLNITKKLAKYVPKDRILISESGIKGPEDVKFLLDAGAKAVLVGTLLMKASNPGQKLAELIRAV
jgi:indole-3-glycerol phosphate synthase